MVRKIFVYTREEVKKMSPRQQAVHSSAANAIEDKEDTS